MVVPRVVLIRHAEACKNVEDRHGGPGTALTKAGRAQCHAVASDLKRAGLPDHAPLICPATEHVAQTAELLHDAGGWPVRHDRRLGGLHLGVLAGLSRAAAASRHPQAAARLDAWRQGRAGVDEVAIPEAETLPRFEQRIRAALADALAGAEVSAVVATRSVVTMSTHLLRLGTSFSYSEYSALSIANGSISIWRGPAANGSFDRVDSVTTGLPRVS